MLIARSLPVSPFFLVPIGILSITLGPVPLTAAVAFTVAINFVTVFATAGRISPDALPALFADSAYFLALVSSFAYAVYEPITGDRRFITRASLRLVAASVVSAAVLYPIIMVARRDQGLVDFFNVQAAAIADAFKASAGADVVQQSLMEREITAEAVAGTVSMAVSRGAVIGHLIFFGVNWRLAQMIASFRRPELRVRHVFSFFRNDHRLVWFLIGSLFAVMATRIIDSSAFAVLAWNGMLLFALLYLVQGMAVVSYNLARPGVPGFVRSLVILAGALVVFRPGINAVVGAVLAVVGVAENWLPLRAPINTEPPSTPEA